MKPGDQVWWYDVVDGRIHNGRLLERTLVVAEAPSIHRAPGEFKDVERWTWDVKTDHGKRFVMPEADLLTSPPAS